LPNRYGHTTYITSLTTIQESVERHDTAEELILRVLELLLENRGFDEYWFGLNQRDLRPEQILCHGRVDGAAVRELAEGLKGREVL
jgi:hypothetical protein